MNANHKYNKYVRSKKLLVSPAFGPPGDKSTAPHCVGLGSKPSADIKLDLISALIERMK